VVRRLGSFSFSSRGTVRRLTDPPTGCEGRPWPKLSKLAAAASGESGFAAPLCGKAPPFRAILHLLFSSSQAGRLSLPACEEEVVQNAYLPERPSLSAKQVAEPQVTGRRIVLKLDKPGACPTLVKYAEGQVAKIS